MPIRYVTRSWWVYHSPLHSVRRMWKCPFGVIPKKYKPGKWRLIFNLSAPHNHSVSDGILKELCSFSYVSVDDVVSSILLMGCGTLMAKLDIKEAYRMSIH